MRLSILFVLILAISIEKSSAFDPPLVIKPTAFPTLVNPNCSHCRDEAKRRAEELKPTDRILAWTRGYSDGGAVPFRFFLNKYRVISDSYGVFVSDPDAGYVRGFESSFEFTFHGWRNGIMVIKHQDGTLYSGLSGRAFDGPRTGTKLSTVPTLVSNWGWWLEHYPDSVAYQMFEKYKATDLPKEASPEALETRGKSDPRLKADTEVLGVSTDNGSRAYPIEELARNNIIIDTINDQQVIILFEPSTKSASAYRPIATQPKKFKAPRPDTKGVSPVDPGVPTSGTVVADRSLTLKNAPGNSYGRFQDAETKSFWDVTGRCVAGELKGYTLHWVDSVQVKWFAWASEYPKCTIYSPKQAPGLTPAEANKVVKEVAGTAEFLRLLPKSFAKIQTIDLKSAKLTLLRDGQTVSQVWPLEPDAEMKVNGWWGRLDQFKVGDRVWVWFKLDRKKNPVSIVMLADEISEFDFHGSLGTKPAGKPRYSPEEIESKRRDQRLWLRNRWTEEGLPGTLAFHHVFSGELDLILDHEAIRWGRSLRQGDKVVLQAAPEIKAVVKSVAPWRERTSVRLVVGELESTELKSGQRLALKMSALPQAVDLSLYPPDIERERSRSERIEWFLASTYCTCGIDRDICTGQFYTLSSCNPNGCGLPQSRRREIGLMIDKAMTDREIFDKLLAEAGPLMLRPHLEP